MTLDDTIATLIESLRESGVSNDLITKAVKDIRQAAKEEQAAKPPTVKRKNRFVVMLRGDVALRAATSGGAWIVVEPDPAEDGAPKTPLLERMRRAVTASNEAKCKGASLKTWNDCFSYLKPKSIKSADAQFSIKTKLPAEVVVLESEAIAP